jgi:AcrR family transcriptional regulator
MAAAEGAAVSTRRERRKHELRRRILDASVALFDAQGVADTTVSRICEQADVAQKTFFNHFATKQQLLRELAGEALERLCVDLEEIGKLPGGTALRIAAFFRKIAEEAESAGPMHRELLTEMIHVAQDAGSEPEQARRLHAAFGALLRDGRAEGDVSRADSLATQTEMLLGAFYALMFNWAHLEGYPLRRQSAAAARFLTRALTIPARGETR